MGVTGKTMGFRVVRALALALLASAWAAGSPARAQLAEAEPDDSCLTPQGLGAIAAATELAGHLDPGTLDFYRFTAEPRRRFSLEVTALADATGALQQPLIGVFDAACHLIRSRPTADDPNSEQPARVTVDVPERGVVTFAVSAQPDRELRGVQDQSGDYRVILTPGPLPVRSVTGRVLSAATGAPLSGFDPSRAFVTLAQCSADDQCSLARALEGPHLDGRFELAPELAVLAGRYRLEVQAEGYKPLTTPIVEIGEGQSFDFGELRLALTDTDLALLDSCDGIPQRGGVCSFRMRVSNRGDTALRGVAWATVSGNIDSELGASVFEVGAAGTPRTLIRPAVQVPPGGSQDVLFGFAVPRDAGAFLCVSAWLGLDPTPQFHVVRALDEAFCVEQSAEGPAPFRVLRGAEAERRREALRTAPSGVPAKTEAD